MKPSRRKTLNLKVKACQHCANADKTKLGQSQDYCDRADIRGGHCLNFKAESKKERSKANVTGSATKGTK